ncbi:hypothetical protein AKJ09_10149 [Labilithrix luteola]|uniref:Uncharacterized protein n=1 Tax=Labilithrix luteola TaxID=1391654 RepID=A0A0K1QCH8_9BACT|nr:hypothetical protein AKJ09_10149 [Labilithrix luteola]
MAFIRSRSFANPAYRPKCPSYLSNATPGCQRAGQGPANLVGGWRESLRVVVAGFVPLAPAGKT